jgi:hypothetical protein
MKSGMKIRTFALLRSFGFLSMVIMVGAVAFRDHCRHAFPLWMSPADVGMKAKYFFLLVNDELDNSCSNINCGISSTQKWSP